MKKDRLDIIYEDKEIIVINKPTHLLTIGTEHEKFNTLYHKVSEYVKKKHKSNKIFIVHRLDKDTSGIVLFAKTQELKDKFQDKWNELCKTREYVAVVEGKVDKPGRVEQYLKETKTLLTYAVKDKDGKLAITNYEPIISSKSYSVVKIDIETGRKNQIRVAMNSINHPIVGDKKYGSTKNPVRRVCLHASKLEITHPTKNIIMTFEAKLPKEYKQFMEQ